MVLTPNVKLYSEPTPMCRFVVRTNDKKQKRKI